MSRPPPIFTLTTDFGLSDPYVGQLKGALLSRCPNAAIVDITHAIPCWDIVNAAVAIRASYAFFPHGTIHLVVVDPGVGGPRAILAAAADGHCFVAPDNGVLTLLLRDSLITAVHRVEPALEANISPTFHGRDIMAPVAAGLANGLPLAASGPPLVPDRLQTVAIPMARPEAGGLRGQVLHVDHFGNVRTSIRLADGQLALDRFAALEIRGQQVCRLVRSYDEAPAGSLLVLVDSSGYLEIAANQDSAARLLGCSPGDTVLVRQT